MAAMFMQIVSLATFNQFAEMIDISGTAVPAVVFDSSEVVIDGVLDVRMTVDLWVGEGAALVPLEGMQADIRGRQFVLERCAQRDPYIEKWIVR